MRIRLRNLREGNHPGVATLAGCILLACGSIFFIAGGCKIGPGCSGTSDFIGILFDGRALCCSLPSLHHGGILGSSVLLTFLFCSEPSAAL